MFSRDKCFTFKIATENTQLHIEQFHIQNTNIYVFKAQNTTNKVHLVLH